MKKRAFTLIELLIVITIIAILSTIIYINWANAQARSRDNKRKADLQAVSSALTLFYADTKAFIPRPAVIGDTGVPTDDSRIGYAVSGLDLLENRNYISKLPLDPLSKAGSVCEYMYLQNHDDPIHKPQEYKLMSLSAEALGDTSASCRANAGDFANNKYSCKTLQVSSSSDSSNWIFLSADNPADIAGCANAF